METTDDPSATLPGQRPTLKLGDRSPAVGLLHQALAERGALELAAVGDQDFAIFGQATRDAVSSFQAAHGLAADGIVGPKTWAALDGAEDAPAAPTMDLALSLPIGRAAAELADAELRAGVREVPPGSNRGPRVDHYLGGALCGKRYAGIPCPTCGGKPGPTPACQGPSWCGFFAAWAVRTAAAHLGLPDPLSGWGSLASAWKWQKAAQQAGAWRSSPAPGRAGILLVPGSGGRPTTGHLVLIGSPVNADGKVATREGNSGNAVAGRLRDARSFSGGFVEVG